MSDEEKMTVFVTSGPDTPQRCATPFYMANIAAAMDNEAEMIFQIDGVLLMKKGVAQRCGVSGPEVTNTVIFSSSLIIPPL